MSTSGPRLSRLMTMVPWLLAHDGVTIDTAAAHFGISAEQCEKDLWLLVVCGLPGHMPDQLVDIQFWDDGRIHVVDPQTLDRPLRLSGDEVMSLIVALRLLVQVPGSHDRATLITLIERLESSLDSAMTSAAMVVDVGVSNTTTLVIEEALRENRKLSIIYAAGTDDLVTDRLVQPLGVITTGGHTYLEGFCERADAIRTFRIDRIIAVSLAEPMPLKRQIPGSVSKETTASVRLRAHARWAIDIYPFTDVLEAADGTIEAQLAFRDPHWLVHVVLSMKGDLQVVAPLEARKWVADAAAAASRSYS
ncbi:MAG: WYL domain-containing protein [Actinobacteria bacterium]|uniref:Unannotated protein n=1 Tax=freshwater metagenome TaxID=449393 RepID=A0A6J7GD14_9ZZZZ|nr:WYL domain-containing protein [Actinomycetota bacterium]